jgi:hypothetical protein
VENGLSHVLEWDTRRGRDYQNLAHFIYCCDRLPVEDLPTPQKLEVWLARVDPPSESFKRDIEEVLTDFWNMATDKTLNDAFRRINKRIAPVEFVFIGKTRFSCIYSNVYLIHAPLSIKPFCYTSSEAIPRTRVQRQYTISEKVSENNSPTSV